MHNSEISTSQHQPIPYKHTISTSPAKIHKNAAFSTPTHKIRSSPFQILTCVLLLNKSYFSPIFHCHYPVFKGINTNVCIYYNYILTKELNLSSLAILLQLCVNFTLSHSNFIFFHIFLLSDCKSSL